MNNITLSHTDFTNPITLDDLWIEAERFGLVGITQIKRGKYYATIEFDTIPGTSLKAGHKGFVATPNEALRLAIENATEIRKAFK